MNLKFYIFLFLMFTLSITIRSQTLSNKVIASGGSYSTASWGSLSATVGEAMITTSSASGTTLLQGFQQPTSGLAGITASSTKVLLASVYPNPSSNTVYLEVNLPNTVPVHYTVYDMNGKALMNGDFTADAMHATTQKLDFSSLSSGMYLISISSNQELIQSLKIQINK